jgi:hypothetical protein
MPNVTKWLALGWTTPADAEAPWSMHDRLSMTRMMPRRKEMGGIIAFIFSLDKSSS